MKKGTNNEVSFVEIILNSWQFMICDHTFLTVWHRMAKFYRVQVIEAMMTFAAAMAKEVILSLLC